MMVGSHVVLAEAGWICVAPSFGLPSFSPSALVLAAVGSVLPDIDHPQSWIGRRIGLISRLLASVVGHRGITHSLFAVALGIYLLHQNRIGGVVTTPLVIGYVSHLAADFLTPGGLRLAWPLRRIYRLPLCRTGSITEVAFVALVTVWVGLRLARVAMPLHF
jgi:inner membrane protein